MYPLELEMIDEKEAKVFLVTGWRCEGCCKIVIASRQSWEFCLFEVVTISKKINKIKSER